MVMQAYIGFLFLSIGFAFFALYFSRADGVTGHVAEWIRKREITNLNPSADSLDLSLFLAVFVIRDRSVKKPTCA